MYSVLYICGNDLTHTSVKQEISYSLSLSDQHDPKFLTCVNKSNMSIMVVAG